MVSRKHNFVCMSLCIELTQLSLELRKGPSLSKITGV